MTSNRKRLTLRITDEEYKKLTEEAKKLGISVNALISIRLAGKGGEKA